MKSEYTRLNSRVIILYNRSFKYYYLRDFYSGKISGHYATVEHAVNSYTEGTVEWKGVNDHLTVQEFFDLFPFATTFLAARAGLKYHSKLSNWTTGVSSPKDPVDVVRLQEAIRQTAAEMLNIHLIIKTKKKNR
jgi:hypothetical protein